MSKSVGNVVDPVVLVDKYGVDALRYHVLREMSYGSDGVYNEDLLVSHINSDLANDLGNLLSRTLAMTDKYFGGIIPKERETAEIDNDLIELAEKTPAIVSDYMDKLDFSRALEEIWKLVSRSNKYIDETQPWVLGKSPEKQARLAQVMYNLTESLRIVTVLVSAAMPETARKIGEQLKCPADSLSWDSIQKFGGYPEGLKIERCDALFPRIELEKKAEQPVKEAKVKPEKAKKENDSASPEELPEGLITIDDFAKVQLRVAEVVACEPHPDADRLLVLQLMVGQEKRQVVSGIAKYYAPEDLVGKTVILVANLKPVNLRGLESNGMILAATKGKKLSLVTVDGIPSGGKVS